MIALISKHRHLLAYLAFCLVVAYLFYVQDGSRKALCAQRLDLDQRIAQTQEYLDDHPSGPIFGIPRSVIIDGQVRNKVTRKNLESIHC